MATKAYCNREIVLPEKLLPSARKLFYLCACGLLTLTVGFLITASGCTSRKRARRKTFLCKTNPIFWILKMNVSSVKTSDYRNERLRQHRENKPKTNPIKANLKKAKMSVNSVKTTDYGNKRLFALWQNKPNSNPIQTQSNPISSPAHSLQKNIHKNTQNRVFFTKKSAFLVQNCAFWVIKHTFLSESNTFFGPDKTQYRTIVKPYCMWRKADVGGNGRETAGKRGNWGYWAGF